MDHNQMLKQMINFNRTSCETAFNTINMFHAQVEKAANANLEKATWLSKEARTIGEEWLKALKSGRESFKNSVDANFKTLETFFLNFQAGK